MISADLSVLDQYSEDALWITVSVLVATCPCALGLATPTAFSAAMSTLNSLGLILKRTDILESLSSVSVFAFDKPLTWAILLLTPGKITSMPYRMKMF